MTREEDDDHLIRNMHAVRLERPETMPLFVVRP